MNPKTILERARAMIHKPEYWIQREYWATHEGTGCDRAHATRFCMVGALNMAHMHPSANDQRYKTHEFLLTAAKEVEPIAGRTLSMWNDRPHRTHAQVMQAFDRAIELAGAQ